MKKAGNIFRKYDIRGTFPDELEADVVRGIGFVIGKSANGKTVAVGRDCRKSGTVLFEWLAEGLLTGGCAEVLDLGIQTTPMTYYAAHTLEPSYTVMITGSHNPSEYNGFKIMKGLDTLHGDSIREIGDTAGEMTWTPSGNHDSGRVKRISVRNRYIKRLLEEFSFSRSLNVVVDAGNGTGGDPSVEILKKLGCRVVPVFCEMDGNFPNHHPDPTVPENLDTLRKKVLEEKADVGIAFDGDADRLGVIDDRGEVVWGDRVLIILARALLKDNPGATVISEVKASKLLFSEVEKAGGRPLMTPTGHSIIKETMRRENALLAGEMSGHIFFRDRYYGFDDALYATLRLLEILSYGEKPLHEYLEDLPRLYNTPEIREECSDPIKFRLVETVTELLRKDGYPVDTTDGARIDFQDGWGLVRASNTQPMLVMRFEAGTREALSEYEELIRKYVEKARKLLRKYGGISHA